MASPRVLFFTPPFVQLNTPYPATPQLVGWLDQLGVRAFQRDLSLDVALDVLRTCGEQPLTDDVIAFLQGRDPDNAETLADPGYLPEGDSFAELERIAVDPDPAERAKLRCSLYLDDLALAIRDQVDPDFGFSRYAEHLGVAVPDFGAILRRLRRRSLVDRLLERHVENALRETRPDIVGVTCPFPGTLIGAFRIAKTVRRLAPDVQLVLGGGYVNTELRSLADPRVKRFFDLVHLDEGYGPWADLLAPYLPRPRAAIAVPPFVKPSYRGLDLSRYVSLAETANPMQRLWSDGRWLKIQLARGCYWRKCAFCDVTLDYIKRFQAPSAETLVDAMMQLTAETGENGFHFTDEAIPPALARGLSREILRRKYVCRWWGNVRFDASFTPELARLMARAGCIAVTGGLECANDRLLKLMNKGITLASARTALANFARAGILVHAYLMYAFPTQTEKELMGALRYVRDRFRDGTLQSAFFHRFALTVHSPIARAPEAFGISVPPLPAATFARNEIPYEEAGAPDWERLGGGLKLALYNYMLGLGLDKPPTWWFRSPSIRRPAQTRPSDRRRSR
ncbi:MAG: B12-binding domain-containing radical SAM protein [Kiritimatiellia bacterium]